MIYPEESAFELSHACRRFHALALVMHAGCRVEFRLRGVSEGRHMPMHAARVASWCGPSRDAASYWSLRLQMWSEASVSVRRGQGTGLRACGAIAGHDSTSHVMSCDRAPRAAPHTQLALQAARDPRVGNRAVWSYSGTDVHSCAVQLPRGALPWLKCRPTSMSPTTPQRGTKEGTEKSHQAEGKRPSAQTQPADTQTSTFPDLKP